MLSALLVPEKIYNNWILQGVSGYWYRCYSREELTSFFPKPPEYSFEQTLRLAQGAIARVNARYEHYYHRQYPNFS